ncbi:MAG: glycoside hydrolase family 127 protein [Eubacteriales bacterium]|nr:glycoside hydrolase family 127 protein [Eubacteriales bacterium]
MTSPILSYDFRNISSTIVPDLSGNGFAGVIRGMDRGGAQLGSAQVFGRLLPVLSLSGGKNGGFLQLPDGIVSDRSGLTVSFYFCLHSLESYGALFGLGEDTGLYLSVLPDEEDPACFLLSPGLTCGGRSQESSLERWERLFLDRWYHAVITVCDAALPGMDPASSRVQADLYLDGRPVGSIRHRYLTFTSLFGCKSCFFGDSFLAFAPLALSLGEIRLFASPLPEKERAALFSLSDQERIRLSAQKLRGLFEKNVSSDLSLPLRGEFDTSVCWRSLHPEWISDSGAVRRPPAGKPDQQARLEAEISYGHSSDRFLYPLTIAALPSAQRLLQEDIDRIRIPFGEHLTHPPLLPARGQNGSVFCWSCNQPKLYDPQSGQFCAPLSGPVWVTLRLEASRKGLHRQKEFSLRFWPVSDALPGPADGLSSSAVPDIRTLPPESGPDALLNSVPLFHLSWSADGLLPENQKRCADYLLLLDPDRMLYNFRRAFGQDTKGALPLGGWEEPAGLLRGHSTGHYLSALAFAFASTKRAEFADRARLLISQLRSLQLLSQGDPAAFRTACSPQSASQSLWSHDPSVWGEGFLSAYSPDQFALLEQFTPYATIWAPYYTLHKLLAGFLDCWRLLENREALACAEGIGSWVYRRLSSLPESHRSKMWTMYIAGEYGGMNESLARLFEITQNPDYRNAARMFDNPGVFDGLSQNKDTISGLHANQHIPQIIGALLEYEAGRDPYYYRTARNFWHIVRQHYLYAIGGVGRGENFKEPDILAGNIEDGRNCETCAAYNLLKLTGLLYRYEPDCGCYMDYYERAMLNQIAASQNPKMLPHAHHRVTYMLPIGPGARREYSNDYEDFTCCHGTGMENHVRYLEHAWHRDPQEENVYFNLYLSSACRLEKQETVLTASVPSFWEKSTIRISKNASFCLHIRIPSWCREDFSLSLNGVPQENQVPGGDYFVLKKHFSAGDSISIHTPWNIRLAYTPDRIDSHAVAAVLFGPLVMAALSDSSDCLTLRLPQEAALGFERDPENPLSLSYEGLQFIPMYQAHDMAYHTYFRIEPMN